MFSIFDILKINIGPSSSHTMGPMNAGLLFIKSIIKNKNLHKVEDIMIDLYGSLSLTGKGHCTDKAILLGLSGHQPDSLDPDNADNIFSIINTNQILNLPDNKTITFNPKTQIRFNDGVTLPEHPNGMKITAYDENNIILESQSYLSLGGGFIVKQEEFNTAKKNSDTKDKQIVTYPFKNATEISKMCIKDNLTIAQLAMANENCLPNQDTTSINNKLDTLWNTMDQCITRGLHNEGFLPVSGIKRRAPELFNTLTKETTGEIANDSFIVMDWVTLYAMAVNEENACGGRIVTAPTNGAAGVVPAVLKYFIKYIQDNDQQKIRDFLITAAIIGMLYKMNASISGAEAGCQAEVGTACSMAAAALTAVQGGTVSQVENAAEIGMEHHLGMTCDPIAGLVQIPCIERNGIGAIKAITASRLALRGNGNNTISLDSCIETMYRTGLDMQSKYRETSLGGLAIHAKNSRKQ